LLQTISAYLNFSLFGCNLSLALKNGPSYLCVTGASKMEPVVPQRGSCEPLKKFLDFFQSESISNNENNFQNQLFHFQIFQLATSITITRYGFPLVSKKSLL